MQDIPLLLDFVRLHF